ncbi:MAG: prephenate dehydratase [Candidatus Peregrinibacteria bacterium]
MNHPVIGIIGGKGCMGKLFTSFFKERGVPVIISDINTKLSNKELAKKADIIIVSVPIEVTEKVIKEVTPHLSKHSALMDFTSIKEPPVKQMLKAPCEVLGMHPLFGNSNPIPNQTIILTPTKKSGPHSKWMEEFLKKNKVKIQKMTPAQHDKTMSVAQVLIEFADIGFLDGLKKTKIPPQTLTKFTPKSAELKIMLAARLIDQNPRLYGSMQIQNPNSLKVLKQYKNSIDTLINIIQKKDLNAFEKYFLANQKHFKSYAHEAFTDSTFLIDKIIEKQNNQTTTTHAKPKKSDAAVLGPKNSFTDIAAKDIPQKYYANTIDEVFTLVETGKTQAGLIPIENSQHGTIRETLDNLFDKNVHITKELSTPIHHALIVHPHAKKSDITTIISHSQALNQCKNYIKKNFPNAQTQPYSSTSAAVEKLSRTTDKSIAVIAPQISADSLKILANNIEDDPNNSTTFILIKKGPASPQPKAKKTSIAFHFDKDSPGSLFTVFKDFASARINMTKIESRPTKAAKGDYVFFLDFEGGTAILDKVKKKVARLKILGSY